VKSRVYDINRALVKREFSVADNTAAVKKIVNLGYHQGVSKNVTD
jgi:hypothetical protein